MYMYYSFLTVWTLLSHTFSQEVMGCVFDDKVLPASPMLDDKTRNNIALRLTNIILKN